MSIQLSFNFNTNINNHSGDSPVMRPVSTENRNIILADLANIELILPELYDEQRTDIVKIENRFLESKGILVTNGTGTGKTFVGLGVAKRFYLDSKRNILIVVPSDQKCKDWISDARSLSLYVSQLSSICDKGKNISITTYSNFYQNEAILKRSFDLVIYDECHYLLQNAKGAKTEALNKHAYITHLPSTFKMSKNDEIKCNYWCDDKQGFYRNMSMYKKLFNKRIKEHYSETKVLFLSASPFSYHKSLLLGDGVLWNIYETPEFKEREHYGYNIGDAFEQFLCTHFGYSMKYNRATIPDGDVDVNLMERMFYDNMVEKGVIIGRQIDVPFDYSRDFLLLNSKIGNAIDEGIKRMYSSDFRDEFPTLARFFNRKHTHIYTSQLLECIKAKEIINHINGHLSLNRKIVIFHNYNKARISHPFKFSVNSLINISDDKERNLSIKLQKEISRFEEKHKDLIDLDLSNLLNARETIKNHFPNAMEFNGLVSKKNRSKFYKSFNSDVGNNNIFIIQTKAGKEGISLHDKTGKHQRVLINLGLPTCPTDAIQTEGRIYRLGLQSNAIFEYATIQTSFERFAYAYKIASRARTAENLAMGSKARNLETSFKEGYQNSKTIVPNNYQGIGGKDFDMALNVYSDWDRAKALYFGTQKKTSKNRSREGIDYYSTPEPLGYKMIQWLNLKPNSKFLEPSVGHGAIGRFASVRTNNTFIDASYELASKAAINCDGEIINDRFENHHIVNKYDGIAMNPPFGKTAKTAKIHLCKALKHLSYSNDARLVAIVPNSKAIDKELIRVAEDKEFKRFYLRRQIILPSCVFNRVGTNVSCKIIIFETMNENAYSRGVIDLSHMNNINDFFNYIEQLQV